MGTCIIFGYRIALYIYIPSLSIKSLCKSNNVLSKPIPYPYNSLDGRENPNGEGLRVLRGGSWASSVEQITTFYCLSADPIYYPVTGNNTGFRCVRNANP